jgi:monofunctional biosynthetic peptidoglycan transglycosylase
MAHNEQKPGRIRGGSTISQQTAKNVFLWPGRSYVRKGLEAYFTVLIEGLWGKRRIMEVYLNVVELGPGIYGAEAAAERYFGVDAAHLSAGQAARLAAVLPSPLRWSAENPGPYVRRRSRRIGGAIGTVRVDGLAACVGKIVRVRAEELPQIESPPAGPRPLPAPRPKAQPPRPRLPRPKRRRLRRLRPRRSRRPRRRRTRRQLRLPEARKAFQA